MTTQPQQPRLVIDWSETENRLVIFFNDHNDTSMTSQTSGMIQKMKTSERRELMGFVAMLKKKYNDAIFFFPMFDLNQIHQQLKQAFEEKAPSNLSQLNQMVMAVGKGTLPLDQLQTMMYQKLKVMIEVEHIDVDITSSRSSSSPATTSSTKPSSVATKVRAKVATSSAAAVTDKSVSDTTDSVTGVRTIVRNLPGGGTSTSTSGGNSIYRREQAKGRAAATSLNAAQRKREALGRAKKQDARVQESEVEEVRRRFLFLLINFFFII